MKIKIKIKKGRKPSATLLIVAFVLLLITKIIGNPVAGGLAIVFAMAVVASVITDKIGGFMRNRKESRE